MKLTSKLLFLMLILSFGVLFKSVAVADWWERGDRPVYPRNEISFPTRSPEPTGPAPTNPPAGGPSVTPPAIGGIEATATPVPGSNSSDEDPCAAGKSYTGDYCGWSPRIGGNDNGGGDGGEAPSDNSAPLVRGLSYTGGEEVTLSDIMLLSGILCLLLYAKSKFAPNINTRRQPRRSP